MRSLFSLEAKRNIVLRTITDSVDMNLSKLWETVEDRGAWHAALHGVAKLDAV